MTTTVHTAPAVRLTDGGEAVRGGAVLVSGDRIAAVGTLDEVLFQAPSSCRVRRWPGLLVPGLLHRGPLPAAPTPRERVHAVLREGRTAVLASSVGDDEELRLCLHRNGLTIVPAPRPATLIPGARADLAAFTRDEVCAATILAGRLVHRRA